MLAGLAALALDGRRARAGVPSALATTLGQSWGFPEKERKKRD